MSADDPLPPIRVEPVGAILARLRRERGLTGADVASMVGMSQPKISRIERGRGTPAPEDIETLARALGADKNLIKDLVNRTLRAQNRIVDWRPILDDFASRQETVADWESDADVVRELAVTVLPGLLQTSGYAKTVFTAFATLTLADRSPVPERTIAAAVAARLKRQGFLHDPGKRLRAVIAENALRGQMCTPAVMLAQLGHLREVARLSNVTIEIIPDDTDMRVPFLHGFTLFDDRLLLIDAYNTGLTSQGEQDVDFYRRVFEAVAAHATSDIDPILDRHELRCLNDLRQKHA